MDSADDAKRESSYPQRDVPKETKRRLPALRAPAVELSSFRFDEWRGGHDPQFPLCRLRGAGVLSPGEFGGPG